MAKLRRHHHRPARPGCCAARSSLRHRARPTSALGIPSRNAAVLAPERSKKTSLSIFSKHSMFVASLTSALATDTRHSRATRSSAMRNRTQMAPDGRPNELFRRSAKLPVLLGWPLGRLFYTRIHCGASRPFPPLLALSWCRAAERRWRDRDPKRRLSARDGRPNATGRHLARAHR